jgi:hypothetical protein
MKTIKLISLFILLFSLSGFAQTNVSVKIRVEKQAMSTPMTPLYDMFFMNFYHTRPVNIEFDGNLLNMYYDNGSTFTKKNVTEVAREVEVYDDKLEYETIRYTNNENVSDTISLVYDHIVGSVELILPTKNSEGKSIGYTSYRHIARDGELAMK